MAGQPTMRLGVLHYVSLLLFQSVSAHVELPTNVTLHCHNLHDLLEWSYEPLVPGLRFRVEIRSVQSKPKEVWVDPPALHANVSLLTDPVDDNMLTVTAVVGQNKSKPAPAGGAMFSYSKVSLVNQKCSVDFPPVAVSVDPDSHILFSFNHPWLLYSSSFSQAKSRKKKSNEEKASVLLPEFTYSVKLNKHLEETLICDSSECEGKLQVDPGQSRNCLEVEGELQKMLVQGSQEYCAMALVQERNKDLSIAFIIIGLLAGAVIVVILFMWFKKKTTGSSLLPKSMNIVGQRRQWSCEMPQEQVVVPEVEPKSSLLLCDENENDADMTPSAFPSADPDLRFRLGGPEAAGIENDGGPGYMEGLDLEAETLNGYEQRPGVGEVVVVELAPGESAKGYRRKI